MIAQSEGLLDLSQARLEEVQQVVITDVAGGDDKQPRGRTGQQMAVAEVRVLADDDPTVLVGHGRDLLIGGPVPVRERRGMEHVVAQIAQPPAGQAAGRRRGTSRGAEGPDRLAARGERRKLQSREQVIALQVGVVGEDLLHRHPRSQQLQQHLDGIPQSTDHRLAVADRRVGGDPVESRHAPQRTGGAP